MAEKKNFILFEQFIIITCSLTFSSVGFSWLIYRLVVSAFRIICGFSKTFLCPWCWYLLHACNTGRSFIWHFHFSAFWLDRCVCHKIADDKRKRMHLWDEAHQLWHFCHQFSLYFTFSSLLSCLMYNLFDVFPLSSSAFLLRAHLYCASSLFVSISNYKWEIFLSTFFSLPLIRWMKLHLLGCSMFTYHLLSIHAQGNQ